MIDLSKLKTYDFYPDGEVICQDDGDYVKFKDVEELLKKEDMADYEPDESVDHLPFDGVRDW